MNLKGQKGRADIILTPHPQSLPMNLKFGSLIINDLRKLRFQGFKARIIRGILSPLRGEGGSYWTRQGTFGVQGAMREFSGKLFPENVADVQ